MTVRSLLFPAFNRRDDGCYISFLKHAEQFVRIIRFVRKERFRLQILHKERRLATVRDSTACHNAACRHPVLVDYQVQFAVQPPFVRLMSWLPPCAPHASACALIYVESIIKISPAGSPIAASASVLHIPLSRQRQNRLCMLFQFPNSGGISLHGAPVRVCARLPRYRVDKQTVVFRHSPAFPCLSGQQVFYPFPRLVAYIVPVYAFIFFHAPILPLFPYPVHTA